MKEIKNIDEKLIKLFPLFAVEEIKAGNSQNMFKLLDRILESEAYKKMPQWKQENLAKQFWENLDSEVIIPAVADLIKEEIEKEVEEVKKADDPKTLGWKESSNPKVFYKKVANYKNVFYNKDKKEWWLGDW